MGRDRASWTLVGVACATLALAGGCVRPFGRATLEAEAPPSSSARGLPPPVTNTGEPTADDMADVLDKLAQVRAMDPAAEEKLLAELRRSPPNTWSLVAEQFRASLAFHQQLKARPRKLADNAEPMDAFRQLAGQPVPAGFSAPGRPAGEEGRPATVIGSLVDPHRVNAAGDPIMADAPPFALPYPASERGATAELSPPAEFAATGAVYPIPQSPGGVQPAGAQISQGDPPRTGPLAVVEEPNGERGGPSTADESSWQRHVERAADDLSGHVKASPESTAEVHQHVSLRMLRLLAGDTEGALEPIPHISPAEQDYWSRQIFALASYLDHHAQPDEKRRAALSVTHLEEALSHLRELGSLALRNLTFCKEVYGYGSYDVYERDVFAAGQQLSLYVEVDNYHSESSEKGYNTVLGASYELVDEKGKRVSGGDFPDVEDCCRSRRRDFHIQFGLTLPKDLSPGRYRLDLSVRDRQSDKRGHATIPFEVQQSRRAAS